MSVRSDEPGSNQARYGMGELRLGKDGVIDRVGLCYDLGKAEAVVGSGAFDG